MGLCGTSSLEKKDNKNLTDINDMEILKKQSKFIFNTDTISEDIECKTLKFKAILGDKEISLFIPKNSKIEMIIIDKKESSWSFIPEEGETDSNGYKNFQYNDLNVGCLLARISSSKKYNIISKKTKFIAEESGSLIICANLDPINYPMYEPKGFINLKIYGGRFLGKEKIDELTGYKYIQYDKTKKGESFSKIYKEISRYINKARSNIKQYINDFLFNFNDINFNIEEYNDLPICEINKTLYGIAEKHCQDLCINGTSGHIGTDGNSFKKRLEIYNISPQDCEECIIFGLKNPILITNFLIIDKYSKNKKNREILLNKDYRKIGISLNEHIFYGSCCVIIFGK